MLGGIANPAMGETYIAVRGRGAERNGRPIRAARRRAMDRASVEFGWSTRVPNERYLECYAALLATGANVRRAASGALGLAYVADGRSDAYVELHINAWDCLAGLLLVSEAGGRVNAFLEGRGLLNGNPVLAAAPGSPGSSRLPPAWRWPIRHLTERPLGTIARRACCAFTVMLGRAAELRT